MKSLLEVSLVLVACGTEVAVVAPVGSSPSPAPLLPSAGLRVEMVDLPWSPRDDEEQLVGSRVPTVAGVIKGFAPALKRCVARANLESLQLDSPTWAFELRFEVGVNGEVLSAAPVSMGALSSDVVACIMARAHIAQFPTDAPPTVNVRFRVQRAEASP